jgi:FMN phosphatase YigB (HAD superfamily)
VSNFYGNLAAVCDDVGVRPFFGVIVDSVWAGCTKPDPLIFRRAVDGLRVAPAEATFVGDSLSRDMAGARADGMPHIWLAGEAGGAACCGGDRVIHTLEDLEGVL